MKDRWSTIIKNGPEKINHYGRQQHLEELHKGGPCGTVVCKWMVPFSPRILLPFALLLSVSFTGFSSHTFLQGPSASRASPGLSPSLRVSPTSVAEATAMCYWWGKWLPAQPPLQIPWSVVVSIWMARRMTLRWPSVAFPISLLSPQTSCSPVLSHQTWLRNCLRLLSLPHSLFFLDIQGLWIYIFSFSTALPSRLRGLGFIPWCPLPHSPALPWHQQPSQISHTHLIVPLLLGFQQFLHHPSIGQLS